MKRLLTAAEVGAFLGITATSVRSIVARHQIQSRGKVGKANLYDPDEVLGAAGAHDRRATHAKSTQELAPHARDVQH